MVAKWIAISIIVGLAVVMIPVIITWLWTVAKVFVSALLLFVLIVGLLALVLRAIDIEIENKRLKEELEQKENDEDESND